MNTKSIDNDLSHVEALQAKKGKIIDYVKMGLDQEQAIILTGTSVAMQKELQNDQDFMDCLSHAQAESELQLIKDLREIAALNKLKGISLETRYLLEHQFPERWASKTGSKGNDVVAPEISEENRGI